MKKKNIDLQKKVSLKKVSLAHLNFEEQSAVHGGDTNVARCLNTRCIRCDSYDPSCPTRPHRTLVCL
ncbi:class I lanthipeptide [Chitinophaga varians]|uniref:class I lanthipeptide n=1 Tax=Chitinophaga varians TaxID=2202339 RepID=UPI001B3B2AA3